MMDDSVLVDDPIEPTIQSTLPNLLSYVSDNVVERVNEEVQMDCEDFPSSDRTDQSIMEDSIIVHVPPGTTNEAQDEGMSSLGIAGQPIQSTFHNTSSQLSNCVVHIVDDGGYTNHIWSIGLVKKSSTCRGTAPQVHQGKQFCVIPTQRLKHKTYRSGVGMFLYLIKHS